VAGPENYSYICGVLSSVHWLFRRYIVRRPTKLWISGMLKVSLLFCNFILQ